MMITSVAAPLPVLVSDTPDRVAGSTLSVGTTGQPYGCRFS
jgi:hypothetical protein